jgi:hypothetical protein
MQNHAEGERESKQAISFYNEHNSGKKIDLIRCNGYGICYNG